MSPLCQLAVYVSSANEWKLRRNLAVLNPGVNRPLVLWFWVYGLVALIPAFVLLYYLTKLSFTCP